MNNNEESQAKLFYERGSVKGMFLLKGDSNKIFTIQIPVQSRKDHLIFHASNFHDEQQLKVNNDKEFILPLRNEDMFVLVNLDKTG